jgi:hypothetical protein
MEIHGMAIAIKAAPDQARICIHNQAHSFRKQGLDISDGHHFGAMMG